MEIRAQGLCLRAIDYSESDKLATVYLIESGKLTVKCKGVKKAGAKLAFAASPLCLAEYIINERGGYYTCIGSTLITSFMGLWGSVYKFHTALSALELLDKYTRDSQVNDDLAIIVIDFLGQLEGAGDELENFLPFLYKFAVVSGYGFSDGRAKEQGIYITKATQEIIKLDAASLINVPIKDKLTALRAMGKYLECIAESKLLAMRECLDYYVATKLADKFEGNNQ